MPSPLSLYTKRRSEEVFLPMILLPNKLLLIFLVSMFMSSSGSALDSRIHLIYYFSTTCPHCTKTTPIVSELSKDYGVEGLVYGKADPGKLGFPVKKGTKKDSKRYSLPGVPSLVVLMEGKTRQVFSGEPDIKDSRAFLRAFQKGALTVSESIVKGEQKKYSVVGWMEGRGEYFKNATFVLTDRKQAIVVKPWLPLEVVKSRFNKKRPRLMSDVMNKPIVLEGTLTKINDEFQFVVRREIINMEKEK